MFDITIMGAFILAYEAFAKITGHRTWTKLTADHDLKAIPVWVFLGWLVVHLVRAFVRKRD